MAGRRAKAGAKGRPTTETILTTPGFAVKSSEGRGRGLFTEVARRGGE